MSGKDLCRFLLRKMKMELPFRVQVVRMQTAAILKLIWRFHRGNTPGSWVGLINVEERAL